MNPTRALSAARTRPVWVRVLVAALVAALLVPLTMMLTSPPARAETQKADNYSLYQLASNASAYFGNQNSPDGGKADAAQRMTPEWHTVTEWPAAGGSLLGYADPNFSYSVEWLVSALSGSSQTISYDSLVGRNADGAPIPVYKGMLDYAYFGAANADLGLDSMSSGVMGGLLNAIAGSIIWFLYGLSMMIGTLFYFIIQILKFVNPFTWFYSAVQAISPTFAEGMTQGSTVAPPLQGLADFISSWYGLIVDIAWQAMVPLFIGFLLIGLFLFKKMDRGSAIKKLIVRVVFIGVGLPLIGSMYTQVLNKFGDDLLGQSAGPTRVVLSTYVDFEAWMMNDRLMVPEGATISWSPYEGHAFNDATMSVRNTALAINKQSHPGAFNDIHVNTKSSLKAGDVWSDNTVSVGSGDGQTSTFAFMETIGILNRYITGATVAASDFESNIKSTITQSDAPSLADKKAWFVGTPGYGDAKTFGETGAQPTPDKHPIISPGGTPGQTGLRSTASDGSGVQTGREFYSTGVLPGCGFDVWDSTTGGPAACNLSPLAAYNYLNTGFHTSSMTLYSSNKATSGFTRENHNAVSQVGTGPAQLMYWANAAVLLACIVILGFWYAIGMLAGSLKRTFGVVAAVPFATLGAMAAISQVIIYSVALILEVLVTLFIYQFVSEFLISLPQIIAGPVATWLNDENSLFGSYWAGAVVVVLMTFLSTLLILGATFSMLQVRKSVLKAMDEAVTKLVNKFLETDTPPALGNKSGGAMPALAAGIGAGAGMAAGNMLASGLGGKVGGSNGTASTPGSTNAGGTNGPQAAGLGGTNPPELGGGADGSDGAANSGGPHGSGGGPGGPGGHGIAGADGHGSDGGDGKGSLVTAGDGSGSTPQSDKSTASRVMGQGGLSNLGYSDANGGVVPPTTAPSGQAVNGQDGSRTGGKPGSSAISGTPGNYTQQHGPTGQRTQSTNAGSTAAAAAGSTASVATNATSPTVTGRTAPAAPAPQVRGQVPTAPAPAPAGRPAPTQYAAAPAAPAPAVNTQRTTSAPAPAGRPAPTQYAAAPAAPAPAPAGRPAPAGSAPAAPAPAPAGRPAPATSAPAAPAPQVRGQVPTAPAPAGRPAPTQYTAAPAPAPAGRPTRAGSAPAAPAPQVRGQVPTAPAPAPAGRPAPMQYAAAPAPAANTQRTTSAPAPAGQPESGPVHRDRQGAPKQDAQLNVEAKRRAPWWKRQG